MYVLSPQSNGTKADDIPSPNLNTDDTSDILDTNIGSSNNIGSSSHHLTVPNGLTNASVKWSKSPNDENTNPEIVRSGETSDTTTSNWLELNPLTITV